MVGPIVAVPSPDLRIEHPGQIVQTPSDPALQAPVIADLLPDPFECRRTHGRSKAHKELPAPVLGGPWAEQIPQKLKVRLRAPRCSIGVPTVDDSGFLRMQGQVAGG